MQSLSLSSLVACACGLAALFVLGGCDNKTEVRSVQSAPAASPITPAMPQGVIETHGATPQAAPKAQGVWLEAETISASKEKKAIMVFESAGCKYCDMLKQAVADNSALKQRLSEKYLPYLIHSDQTMNHKLAHGDSWMEADTQTLMSVYGVSAFPTIVITDHATKSILVIPGYLPAKQFLATLDFVDKGLWEGKNRKNGEVYEALRAYYEQTGAMKEEG